MKVYEVLFSRKLATIASFLAIVLLTHSTRLNRQQPFQEVGDTHAALSFANQLGYWLFCGEKKLLFLVVCPLLRPPESNG